MSTLLFADERLEQSLPSARRNVKARRASADTFGPYGIEQYLLMEVLSKQEVASNVLEVKLLCLISIFFSLMFYLVPSELMHTKLCF